MVPQGRGLYLKAVLTYLTQYFVNPRVAGTGGLREFLFLNGSILMELKLEITI